jgi:hypothetical protein
MAKTKLLRWINTPSQIVELTTMLRQGFAEAPDEQRPTTREIGCLDAPQILPAGAYRRFLTDDGAFGWPAPHTCLR